MEYLIEIGLFVGKAVVVVVAVFLIVSVVVSAAAKQKDTKGELHVDNLTRELRKTTRQIQHSLMSKKARKKAQKSAKKQDASEHEADRKVFLIDFKGSMDAKEVESLRREVTAVLQVAADNDEVIVRIESGGGVVHGYGLGASQLQRIKERGLKLTVTIDKVAASGGYMMACVANTIVAAPFAVVGSIGVIAQLPNFHRLLKKNDVDFEQVTAGEYKRTLTLFGENTDADRAKFKQDIDEVHVLFKQHVSTQRPSVDIDRVATGEVWYGQQAVALNLVDQVATSDDIVLAASKGADVIRVSYQVKKNMAHKLTQSAVTSIEQVALKWLQRAQFWHR
ncbi:protease SohB [Aliidiomarina maris]|uniref:Protease SohB n=1 Tax=Aliidiomarina maris TaxID=531312 RepID=A0A327WWR0_9GAMM|nr:protease SohB [Aliidiomarina maris]RAJ96920.1 serine protease SohB [Aliidiomarina maris]RUO24142.1 protease SohB [Aliidiomarina maris]